MLFEAVVLEARIYDLCQKDQHTSNAIKRARRIVKVLVESLPDGKSVEYFYTLPTVKTYRELYDKYKYLEKIEN
jgi:hypothetical protein